MARTCGDDLVKGLSEMPRRGEQSADGEVMEGAVAQYVHDEHAAEEVAGA